MTRPKPMRRAPCRSMWLVAGGLVMLNLGACANFSIGIGLPIGALGGLGVSVGSDGRVGAQVGVGSGNVSVGVGTSTQLPARPASAASAASSAAP